MAHVAQYKKEIVGKLKELIKKHQIIASVNMESLPTPQLQNMRAQLREKDVTIYMAKRRLIKIAIDDLEKEKQDIGKLKEYLKGMPALLFSNENPFSLYQTLQKNKSPAPAKAGQIAPKDIVVPAGPTSFAPGPIISELGQCGIKAGIEGGKVVVKEDSLVVKEGEEIKENIASILTRLGINPMEIGLDLVAAYEDGEILTRDILAIEPEEYLANIRTMAGDAFALATEIGYLCKETVVPLITKAATESRGVAIETTFPAKDIISDILAKAEVQASALNALAGQ
ncbi:MAG: 50S ribosomal protein L10 [Candidatus Woesearchaeota archaeon]